MRSIFVVSQRQQNFLASNFSQTTVVATPFHLQKVIAAMIIYWWIMVSLPQDWFL